MMYFPNGMPLLDINNSTHKYVLQYLFMKRINQSLDEWITIWNRHKLRLPHGQQYFNPKTSKVSRSIVPNELMANSSINFAKYSTLYKLENRATNYYLFEEEDDDDEEDEEDDDFNDEALKFSTAHFELSFEKYILLRQYEPLTLSNTAEECMERYINCIMDMYDLN